MRAYNADSAGDGGLPAAHVALAGDVVKVYPAVLRRDVALCTDDLAVGEAVEGLEGGVNLFLSKLLRRLDAPAGEHLVCVVAVVMVMVVLMLVVVVMVVVVLMLVVMVMVVVVVAALVPCSCS